MKKQFVTYEIALKLKELGFDEVCLAVYFRNKFQLVKGFNINNVDLHVANQMDAILAPLWQQVIDWFREKYDIHIYIDFYDNYVFGIKLSKEQYYNRYGSYEMELKTYYKSREQAILKAIELCKKN